MSESGSNLCLSKPLDLLRIHHSTPLADRHDLSRHLECSWREGLCFKGFGPLFCFSSFIFD